MTTTRISHTGHNHPNTTAARTACRKAIKATPVTPAPLPLRVIVGKGKAVHAAVIAADGTAIGAACGAGLQRGLRATSSLRSIRTAGMTCDRCAKVG
jgi:hypothetical protein